LVPALAASDLLVLILGGTSESFVTALMALFLESVSLLAALTASIATLHLINHIEGGFFFLNAAVAALLFPPAFLVLTLCLGGMDVLVVRVE
jgi:hypothetical protein